MSRRDGSIYVGRLAKNTRTRDLEDIFEPYGRMMRCDIKYGTEMAYAFIDFEDRRDAEDCVKYEHGREINGQSIIVEWAKGGKDRRMTRRSDSSSQSFDECFRCRRTGHWARDCPEMRFGGRGGGGGGRGGGGRWRSPSPRRRSRSRSRDRKRRSRSRSRDRRRKRSRSTPDNRKRSRSGSRKSRSASDDRKKVRRSKSGSPDKRKSASASKSRSRSQSLRRSKSGSKSKSRSKSPRKQIDNGNEKQANGDSPKYEIGADGDDYGDEDDGRRSRSGSKD